MHEHGFKKCFQCGERGHERKLCPYNIEEFPEVSTTPTTLNSKKSTPNTNLFPVVDKMSQKTTDPASENPLIDFVADGENTKSPDNNWVTVNGKRKRRAQKSNSNKEDGEPDSHESSPTNESKAPRVISTKSKLIDSYNDWKQFEIGNNHLQNEKLLQFLVIGSENISEITDASRTFSSNPSLLRRQLESLIGRVDEIDLKHFIKDVCELIPIGVSSNP